MSRAWLPEEAIKTVAAEMLAETLSQEMVRDKADLAEATTNLEGFINGHCWSVDEQRGEERKATEWPGQSKLRRLLESSERVIGLKARGVGWTWLGAWYLLYRMAKPNIQTLYMCQRQGNARSFIRRVKWCRRKLEASCGYPKLADDGDAADHLRPVNGSELIALPRDPDAIHFYHPAIIWADEWARIEKPIMQAITGAIGFKGQFVGISTALGSFGEYYEVYRDAMAGGSQTGFHRVFSPWTDCPDYKERPNAGSFKLTAQEFPELEEEAFIETAPGEAVYPEFNAQIHVAEKLGYFQDIPILRGWDFGGRPACVWTQLTPEGGWRILRELQEGNIGVRAVGQKVLHLSEAFFPKASGFIDFADPSGLATRETDAKSAFQILRELGIRPSPSAQAWALRRDAMSRWMTRLIAGRAALQIDSSCELLIKAFKGLYRYPDRSLETTKPVKDMFSDLPNCAEYVAAVLEGFVRRGVVRKKPAARRPLLANPVTGY